PGGSAGPIHLEKASDVAARLCISSQQLFDHLIGAAARRGGVEMPGGGFHPPYPSEFKVEAVRLVREGGRPISEVAKGLGVTNESVRLWLKQSDLDAGRRSDG